MNKSRFDGYELALIEHFSDPEAMMYVRRDYRMAVGSILCRIGNTFEVHVPKKVEWTGEGLPPVGTVCEFLKHNSPPTPRGKWLVGEIRYSSHFTVIISGDMCEHVHHPRNCSFRPIHTPEQIAAEERENELNRMVATVSMLDKGWARKVCAGLYDAGYRKSEIVDE